MIRFLPVALALSFLAAPARSQYFFHDEPRPAQRMTRFPAAVRVNAAATVKRQIHSPSPLNAKERAVRLEFAPASSTSPVTIAALAAGLFLGELTTDATWYLGALDKTALAAGTYRIWIGRKAEVWRVYATDASGVVQASSSEVELDVDQDDPGPWIGATSASILVPPYAATSEKKTRILAGEGPPTVNCCRCWNVRVCSDLAGLRICHTERHCSCWC
jgi:hypothetical protein